MILPSDEVYTSYSIVCIIVSCFRAFENERRAKITNITAHCLNNGCIKKNHTGNN